MSQGVAARADCPNMEARGDVQGPATFRGITL